MFNRKGKSAHSCEILLCCGQDQEERTKIVCCSTEDLVADYSSKPLHGRLFTKHRNTIMGIIEGDLNEYKEMHVAVLKQYDLYVDEKDLFNI